MSMPAAEPETPIIQGELYAGYAAREPVRWRASSGGVVSAILLELIDRGHAGALVSRITSDASRIRPVTFLARTPTEVLDCAGSSYVDTPVVQAARRCRDLSGPIAVVALPCQVRAIRRLTAHDETLRERLFPVIGLFCRGNVDPEFYDAYLARRDIDPARVESLRVARGCLGGRITVGMKDGSERRLPFAPMNALRILGVRAKRLCAWCDEHMGAEADIAVGDIFTGEFIRRPIKHSAFIAWTQRGTALLRDLHRRGTLTAELVELDAYRRAFKRVARFTDSLASRSVGARLAGRNPPVLLTGRFDPFHAAAWSVILLNDRLSKTPWGKRLLFSLPDWLVCPMAMILKGLTRL